MHLNMICKLLIGLLALLPAQVGAGFFENPNSPYLAPSAADQIIVGDSTSAITWRAVPDCQDSSGNHLNYTASSNTFSCGNTQASAGTVWSFSCGAATLGNGLTTSSWFADPANNAITNITAPTCAASGATSVYIAPLTGTAANLFCQITTAPGAAKSTTLSLYDTVAGNTALTCTISGASATSCNDVTHTATVTAGNCYSIQETPTGVGIAGFSANCSMKIY